MFYVYKSNSVKALCFLDCTLVVEIKFKRKKRLLWNAEKLKKLILHLETKDRVDSLSCTVDVTVQTGWTTGERCEGPCCAHTETVDGVCAVCTRKQLTVSVLCAHGNS